MDAGKAGVLFQFPQLKGLNTQAALPDAPNRLHNAQLTRTGGYAPQRAGRTLKTGVTSALRMGIGNDLWATDASGTVRRLTVGGDEADATIPPTGGPTYPVGGGQVNPDGSPYTINAQGAVLLMPGLALLPSGDYLTPLGVKPVIPDTLEGVSITCFPKPPLVEGDLTPTAADQWPIDHPLVVYAQRVRDGAWCRLDLPVQDSVYVLRVIVDAPVDPDDRVMFFAHSPAEPSTTVRFLGAFARGSYDFPTPHTSFLGGKADVQTSLDVLTFGSVTAAEYHQGRIWLCPGQARNRGGFGVNQTPAVDTPLDTSGLTLYYSAVTAPGVIPRWTADNYLTLPARSSRRIVALASVGRTLFALCDREVFAIQGNSDRDLLVEHLGDCIGCVASGSVQTLAGAVLYVSDAGVMLLQGGQAQEISGDVRDLVAGMGRVVSSTVCHRTETYYLRGQDGEVLMYSLRERAWVTRDDPGGPLVRSGGLPLAISSTGLELLDDPAGTPLEMTATFPHVPAGGWGSRKHFRAVALGAIGAGVVHAEVSVLDRNAAAQHVESMQAPVTEQRSLLFGLKNASGEACAVTLQTSGDLLLLPPLQVLGAVKGEVQAQ